MNVNCKKEIYEEEPQKRNITHLVGRISTGLWRASRGEQTKMAPGIPCLLVFRPLKKLLPSSAETS